jgi:hypothetical protein
MAAELVTERELHAQRLEQLRAAALAPSIPESALINVVAGVLRAEKAFVARRAELEAQEAQRRSATNWAEIVRQQAAFAALKARHDRAAQLASYIYDRAVAERARAAGARAAALARDTMLRAAAAAAEIARARELLRGRPGAVASRASLALHRRRAAAGGDGGAEAGAAAGERAFGDPHRGGVGERKGEDGDGADGGDALSSDPADWPDDGAEAGFRVGATGGDAGLFDLTAAAYRACRPCPLLGLVRRERAQPTRLLTHLSSPNAPICASVRFAPPPIRPPTHPRRRPLAPLRLRSRPARRCA